jgi:hypothetical protein
MVVPKMFSRLWTICGRMLVMQRSNQFRHSDSLKKGLIAAEFSDCRTYRYTLRRRLDTNLRWVRPALFVMLNPSTADEFVNDPTISRCISFAQREGCSELTVVNLFALRATDPRELAKHAEPIGALNDLMIAKEINKHLKLSGLIVAAWGAHPLAQARGEDVKKMANFQCLGTTKNGSPRHPLYVKGEQPFVELL